MSEAWQVSGRLLTHFCTQITALKITLTLLNCAQKLLGSFPRINSAGLMWQQEMKAKVFVAGESSKVFIF